MQAVELHPLYYRDNFLSLCATVEARYGDLLLAQETAWLRAFRRLGEGAQCLLVRMLSRRGPAFREDRFSYPEIGPAGPALDELIAAGMTLEAEALPIEELGRLYTRSELQRAFSGLPPPGAGGGKDALLAAINAQCNAEAQLAAVLATLPGRVVMPRGSDTVQLLQLLFFGNRGQDLTEFVLSDLGVARYYPYSLQRRERLFTCRKAVDEYLLGGQVRDRFHELREAGDGDGIIDLACDMPSMGMAYASSARRWHQTLNRVARELERLDEADLAMQLYAGSALHPARERRARLLERSGDFRAAQALCREIIQQPWCEAEAEAAGRILPRVQRKLGEKPAPRRRDQFREVRLQVPRDSDSVEQDTAAYLLRDWPRVYYVENTLMNGLFGLAFWEQLFAPVPGAFHNPFQSVPADMYSREFAGRRQAPLEQRLRQLRDSDLGEELLLAWRRYHPYQCHWVNWRTLDEELVYRAGTCIPRAHLLAIWQRQLFDPGENRRGFPDLFACGEAPGEYSLIEVKGPGDALQDSQKRWLRFFGRQGIPAEVAWVNRGE